MNSNFLRWCAKQGLRSKHLTLRHTPHGKGLFVEEAVARGSILVSVPFIATLNRQCTSLRDVPSIEWCQRLSQSLGMGPHGGSELLWLTLCVSNIADLAFDSKSEWQPYFEEAQTAVVHLERSRSAAVKQLTPGEMNDFQLIQKQSKRTLRLLAKLLLRWKRKRGLPSRELVSQLTWAHDLVVSRAIHVPVGCLPSTPMPVDEFVESTGCVSVPCIVPLIDFINSAPEENCELLTCEERSEKGQGPLGSLFLRRKLVVCATQDMKPGQELFFAYNTDDRPASVARFGFCQ